MKIEIWVEMSGRGVRASMQVEVPDEEVIGGDGQVDEEKLDETAKEYLGNLIEWGVALQ